LTYSVQETLVPNFDNETGSSNQINLRSQIPLGNRGTLPDFLSLGHALGLIKFKLPLVLSGPSDSNSSVIAGAGDLTAVALAMFGSRNERWVAGPDFRFPTGSNYGLGSGKWSIGPAFGYTHLSGRWALGFYTQSFFSYAGTRTQPRVGQTQIQPTVSYTFGHGWTLSNSEMQYVYDYHLGALTNAPLGFRIAKKLQFGDAKFVLGFEAEKNMAHVSGAAAWALRLDAKWILPRS